MITTSVRKQLLLAHLWEAGEISGYDFVKRCQKRGIPVSNAAVYPYLHELETEGYVTAVDRGKRKVYALTEQGREQALQALGNGSLPPRLFELILVLSVQARTVDSHYPDRLDLVLRTMEELVDGIRAYRSTPSSASAASDGGRSSGVARSPFSSCGLVNSGKDDFPRNEDPPQSPSSTPGTAGARCRS